MCCCIRSESGQATVEAAFLFGIVLFLFVLLVQPICIFYTRATMASAASEGARLISTKYAGESIETYERFVKRRLEAVPDIDIFHKGGKDGWSVSVEGSEEDKVATVAIDTAIEPLPILGLFAAPFASEDGAIHVAVKESETIKPEWLKGGYDAWISAWSG